MADAFIHIPALRDRLIAPETSKARVTEAVLAQWDARVKALGGDADWRLADDVREASRQTVLQSFDQAADLWVFAYGSLMWDPAIHFAEVRRASLSGFKRCFNYQVLAGRGTPQAPGLVLSLVPANVSIARGLLFVLRGTRLKPSQFFYGVERCFAVGTRPVGTCCRPRKASARGWCLLATPPMRRIAMT